MMDENISEGSGLFGQLARKLDAIDAKQDSLSEQYHQAVVAMTRMEERQKMIHTKLIDGKNTFSEHNGRLDSLERSRDKLNTIIGVLTGLWTMLAGFCAWIYANFSITMKH
jgi:chromosome segregation ATPase